jgi:hypothetical protein
MKNLNLSLALLSSALLMSCGKPNEIDPPQTARKVEYVVSCDDCKITYDIAGGKRVDSIKGEITFYNTNRLDYIEVMTEGVGDSKVILRINGTRIYEGIKTMTSMKPAIHQINVKEVSSHISYKHEQN